MTSIGGGLESPVRAWSAREKRRLLAPPVFVLVNAVAFCLVRPGVPDLWAARARASAVVHGVGLTYWFGWFGGSTPGGYSVLTPFVCAVLGTELVAGVAAVAIGGLATLLVRDTRLPAAGAWAAAIAVVINLWCGRVPFLLGAAFAVAAIVFVRRRRRLPAAALTVLSVLASPVSGAFLGLALSGALLAPRTRAYRGVILLTVGTAFGTLVALGLLFGMPGPEPFPPYLLAEIAAAILLMLLLRPPAHLRLTLAVSAVAALVLFSVPNGLGANFARLALFCLPAAAVALSRRRLATVVALMAPILVFGGLTSVTAMQSAAKPSSELSYYRPLAAELDTLPAVRNHRLELVDAGRAAYAALLDHATLARGWETQEDLALNPDLVRGDVDPDEYAAWLHDNAVGYVAVDVTGPATPEARLAMTGTPDVLQLIWGDARWRLYQVRDATAIVAGPARLEAATQAAMRVRVPCACRTLVRVRWSRFLTVSPWLPRAAQDAVEDSYGPRLVKGPSGWTTLVTDRPGTYLLDGLL